MPSVPDRCHVAEIQSGHSSNACPKRKTKLRELHSVAGMQSRRQSRTPFKVARPFTGEPVPADRAKTPAQQKRKKSHGRHMDRNATWPAEKGGSTSDRPGKQMNRNATWPAEKPAKRADTSSDKPGKQMNRNVASPAEKGGHRK